MNNDLLRYALIVIVLLVGVLALALCAEGLCAEGPHVCFSAADRSRPLVRLFRRLSAVRASAASLAILVLAPVRRGLRSALAEFAPTPALLRVSALRI